MDTNDSYNAGLKAGQLTSKVFRTTVGSVKPVAKLALFGLGVIVLFGAMYPEATSMGSIKDIPK